MEGRGHELQLVRRANPSRQHVLSRMRRKTRHVRLKWVRPRTPTKHPAVPTPATVIRPCFRSRTTYATRKQHATNGPNSTRYASRHGAGFAATTESSPRSLSTTAFAQRFPSRPTAAPAAGQLHARKPSTTAQRYAQRSTRSIHRQRRTTKRKQCFTARTRRYENCPQSIKFANRCHGQSSRRGGEGGQRRAEKPVALHEPIPRFISFGQPWWR